MKKQKNEEAEQAKTTPSPLTPLMPPIQTPDAPNPRIVGGWMSSARNLTEQHAIHSQKKETEEQKIKGRELRSTRRQQMQENEKEIPIYSGLRSGRIIERSLVEFSLSRRCRDTPD